MLQALLPGFRLNLSTLVVSLRWLLLLLLLVVLVLLLLLLLPLLVLGLLLVLVLPCIVRGRGRPLGRPGDRLIRFFVIFVVLRESPT